MFRDVYFFSSLFYKEDRSNAKYIPKRSTKIKNKRRSKRKNVKRKK